MEIERKTFEAEVKEFDEKDLTVVHFISTEKRDRGRDILYADGMKMEGKPVVLFMHGFGNIGPEPIAKPLWIKKGEFKNRKGVQAKTQFFPDEMGQRLWKKTTEGYMPNWSVGWRPLRHEFKTEKDGQEIRHVYEWELLEYSLVAVPMQPDAQTTGDGKDKQIEEIFFKMLPEEEEKRGDLMGWKKDDGTWEEKPYPNEHACRLEDPGKYIRIRRENDKFGKGIHAIWGVQGGGKPVELQAIRLSKEKFTAAEARAWLKDHDYKCKAFEPASEKCEKCGEVMKWICKSEDCSEGEMKCGCKDEKKETGIDDQWKVKIGESMAMLVNGFEKIKEELAEAISRLDTLSVKPGGEEKDKEAENGNPPEPRKVLIVNTDEQKREASKQLSEFIGGTIARVVKESVKEQFDKLRGKVS